VKFLRKNGILIVSALFIFIVAIASGSYLGFIYTKPEVITAQNIEIARQLNEQFLLAQEDIDQGRNDLALARYEYIYRVDPNFPGVEEQIEQVRSTNSAPQSTLIPSPTATPGITPTPTQDLRPLDELFTETQKFARSEDWQGCINTILQIRQANLDYQPVDIDGLLYLCLRQRGMKKIQVDGNLEGGIYDLALVEKIGPLDSAAYGIQNVARLYLYGLSFWDVYPEKAIYYFSQVVAAMPSMHDASGWTAAARYRAALLQYAASLSNQGDWCAAQSQYEMALSAGSDDQLLKDFEFAKNKCNPPIASPPATTQPPVVTAENTPIPSPVASETIEPPPAITEAPPPITEPPVTQPPTEPPPVETTVPPVPSEPPYP
jgi:tetratricopeptide (TPR) repeat protein